MENKSIFEECRGDAPTEEELEYYRYLEQHIANVGKAWKECLKPHIIDGDLIADMDFIIHIHDQSKYDDDEFSPYVKYFYGKQLTSDEVKHEFDVAWLLHQKKNPHHWQYWVLIEDGGENKALDMPLVYILEMLCDWQSFAYIGGTSAQDWYESNKEKMILSDKTREIVEYYLPYMKENNI